MDMEPLENFLVIARENNITRAAQTIHSRPPCPGSPDLPGTAAGFC